MSYRHSMGATALAGALLMTLAGARAFDEGKFPDLNGQWSRPYPHAQWDRSKPRGPQQHAPLTAEYQAIFTSVSARKITF
jgi:hypothetical protein